MSDKIDIFLGDVKCALQRFQPKPGDVFVLTFPFTPSHEEATEIWRRWNEHIPYDIKVACVSGDPTIELKAVGD